jgi:hypothetical protein
MREAFGIDKDKLKLYARAEGGKKAQKLLHVLSKTDGFVKAFNSPIGQEVMEDALEVAEEILDKIVNETASDADRAEFRALKKIIARWQNIVATHNGALNELQKQ